MGRSTAPGMPSRTAKIFNELSQDALEHAATPPPSRTIEAVAPLCASGPDDVKSTAASQIAIADPAATAATLGSNAT